MSQESSSTGPCFSAWSAPLQQPGVQQLSDIARLDRAVTNAGAVDVDLDERLEPEHAARPVAHDADVVTATGSLSRERDGDLVGADGAGRGVAGDVDGDGHWRAPGVPRR